MTTFTSDASSTNENADSVSPNSSARAGGIRPAATGRARVRFPISLSMSRSSTWFSADAPPHASASPVIVTTASHADGAPFAATNMAPSPVTRSSDMIRGFVSVT